MELWKIPLTFWGMKRKEHFTGLKCSKQGMFPTAGQASVTSEGQW